MVVSATTVEEQQQLVAVVLLVDGVPTAVAVEMVHSRASTIRTILKLVGRVRRQ